MSELPYDIRVPLHELQADMDYLFGRVAADGSLAGAFSGTVKAKLAIIETELLDALSRRAANSAGGVETEPVAFKHTLLHPEGHISDSEVNESPEHPFGRPGRDFDESFTVKSSPLYTHPSSPVSAEVTVTDEMVETALLAPLPGGAEVWHHIDGGGRKHNTPTAMRVMRAALLAALNGGRENG